MSLIKVGRIELLGNSQPSISCRRKWGFIFRSVNARSSLLFIHVSNGRNWHPSKAKCKLALVQGLIVLGRFLSLLIIHHGHRPKIRSLQQPKAACLKRHQRKICTSNSRNFSAILSSWRCKKNISKTS